MEGEFGKTEGIFIDTQGIFKKVIVEIKAFISLLQLCIIMSQILYRQKVSGLHVNALIES